MIHTHVNTNAVLACTRHSGGFNNNVQIYMEIHAYPFHRCKTGFSTHVQEECLTRYYAIFLMWPNDAFVCVCAMVLSIDTRTHRKHEKGLRVACSAGVHISLILIHTSPNAHNSKEYLLLNNRITTVHIIYCSASHSWKFRWKHKICALNGVFCRFLFILFRQALYYIVLCVFAFWLEKFCGWTLFNRFARIPIAFIAVDTHIKSYTKQRAFLSPRISNESWQSWQIRCSHAWCGEVAQLYHTKHFTIWMAKIFFQMTEESLSNHKLFIQWTSLMQLRGHVDGGKIPIDELYSCLLQ